MIELGPILPVLVIDDPQVAEPLGRALLASGIGQVEVTLRTGAALDALRVLASIRGLRVGAGTVLSAGQADAAADAGARFLVSPGLSDEVLNAARAAGIPAVPGIATATELMRARSLGLRTVKFFPAEQSGGRAVIAALAAVFPEISFIPTGGIDAARARDYLLHPSVVAVGGSWMVPPEAIASGDIPRVEALCREALEAVG
jgi:2-dehydro-3-deoxyphosphogluconate aldolase/(4S)-4-hydroxy-2-oxoglutarate aldolase